MKISLSLVCFGALLILGGCSSNASDPGLSSEKRQEQLKSDTSIPAPAQQRVDEQIANKSKMDAMRAQDAAKAAPAP